MNNTSPGETFFRLRNVSLYTKAENGNFLILRDINIEVRKGEWVSIVGRNRSGKTALSKLLCGLLNPSNGELLIRDRRIEDLRKTVELPRTVGYLFSNPENQIIYPIVEDDVSFGPINLGFPLDQVKDRVNSVLKLLGLEGYQKKSVAFLSWGEMKKVALAGILVMEPKAIVIDDPFLMLDKKGLLEMVEIIKGLKDHDVTVVSTMSSLEEAIYSDRVFILQDGKIILEGEFREILAEKEIIENAGLELPKITQLIYYLRERGVSIPIEIMDVADMAELLLHQKPSSDRFRNT